MIPCSLCNTPKEEKDFYTKKRKRKNGTVYEYRESTCKSCIERAKYLRRKASPEAYERMLERSRRRAKRKYKENPLASKERGKAFIQKKIIAGTHKEYWIKNKYGVTLVELNTLREAQSYRCKLCGKSEEELGYVLNIDHCHNTGKVRGLLCTGCNIALGSLEKIIKMGLDKFLDYIK